MNLDNKNIFSFLSCNIGALALIDIKSEFMRCFGEFRYEIYGLYMAFK